MIGRSKQDLQSYQYAECRDIRHAWHSVGDTVLIETRQTVRVFSRGLECTRCGTQRVDIYQIAGHLVIRSGVHYRYPADYQVAGGLDIEELRWSMFDDAVVEPKRSNVRRIGLGRRAG